MVIYVHLWSCMVMYGYLCYVWYGHGMVIYGLIWSCMVMYGHLWPCIVMYGNGHVLSCMGLKGIERRSCVNSYEFVCLTQLCTIRACFIKILYPILCRGRRYYFMSKKNLANSTNGGFSQFLCWALDGRLVLDQVEQSLLLPLLPLC